MFLGQNQQMTEADKSYIEQFRSKLREFTDSWNYLLSVDKNSLIPSLQVSYQKLIDEGQPIKENADYIKSVIDGIASTVQSVGDWVSKTYGSISNWASSQVSTGLSWFGFSGMGQVPVIALAAIAATIVAFLSVATVYVSRVSAFKAKVAESKRLQQQGMSPAQITERLNAGAGGFSLFGGGGSMLPLLGVGLLALFFFGRRRG